MSIPMHLTIPIHASKHSETIVMFVEFKKFKKSFQRAFSNGDVWGAYLSKNGNVTAQDYNGKSHYKILKSK